MAALSFANLCFIEVWMELLFTPASSDLLPEDGPSAGRLRRRHRERADPHRRDSRRVSPGPPPQGEAPSCVRHTVPAVSPRPTERVSPEREAAPRSRTAVALDHARRPPTCRSGGGARGAADSRAVAQPCRSQRVHLAAGRLTLHLADPRAGRDKRVRPGPSRPLHGTGSCSRPSRCQS